MNCGMNERQKRKGNHPFTKMAARPFTNAAVRGRLGGDEVGGASEPSGAAPPSSALT